MIQQIRARRLAKGWSMGRLAAEVGVSRQAVFHWETGDRAPSLPNLDKVAIVLGLDYEELVSLRENT